MGFVSLYLIDTNTSVKVIPVSYHSVWKPIGQQAALDLSSVQF